MTAKKPAACRQPAAPTKANPPRQARRQAPPVDAKPAAKAAGGQARSRSQARAPRASHRQARGQAGAKAKAGKKGAEPPRSRPGAGRRRTWRHRSRLEGEVEVEAEVVVVDEKEAKAKPLRMKVSRAKERALMREFGLDETTLTEEEATKRRQELKTLIKMGKTRGFLTHQEINDHLPEKLVNEEILEAIVSMLNDMGIAVYEQAPDAATLLISGGNTTTATEEEAEEAAEAALSTVDSEFGRTTDPVRMYMREMGTVELLTREGEIEIAKRIEGGLQAMMLAISASPTTIAEILSMADKIGAGEMQISEAVDGFIRSTRPTTTWPKKTSTSSTKKTTTTARAAARR
jgi:RNA polymerase primary sigma factor